MKKIIRIALGLAILCFYACEKAVSFEEGKDYIKINGVKYEKVD